VRNKEDNDIKKFLDEVLPYMDDSDDVQRYAMFMAREGLLITDDGGALSGLGTYYTFWHRDLDGKVSVVPGTVDGKMNGRVGVVMR
jgi:spore coat protein CotH